MGWADLSSGHTENPLRERWKKRVKSRVEKSVLALYTKHFISVSMCLYWELSIGGRHGETRCNLRAGIDRQADGRKPDSRAAADCRTPRLESCRGIPRRGH